MKKYDVVLTTPSLAFHGVSERPKVRWYRLTKMVDQGNLTQMSQRENLADVAHDYLHPLGNGVTLAKD